ncbi:MAG: class I SAM-dependent methyltransferase [Candidatus Micrarchaeota archaeon]
MDDKEFRKWNSVMFNKYGNDRVYYHPNPLIRYIENRRVSAIIRAIGEANTVLEVGCGEGHVLSLLNAKRKIGIDISKKALKIASERTGAQVALADAENIPFADGCFDALVCTEVLEHTRNPRRVIKECMRVVKNGGIIVISIPNEKRINFFKDLVWKLGLSRLFSGVPKRMDSEWHLHSFDLEMLKKITPWERVRRVIGVPFLLSLRYVVILENKNKSKREVSYLCPDCRISLSQLGKKFECKNCKRKFESFPFLELLPKGFL